MLYNPEWKTTTNPLDINSLILWLEKQPADKEYIYAHCSECLLAQYFSAMGFKNVLVDSTGMRHGDWWTEKVNLPQGWNYLAVCAPKTMGAALERARKRV